MQITSKGQVTIPIDIREKMGFLPNTSIRFVIKNKRVYLEKEKTEKSTRGKLLIQAMRGKGDINLTTDEIMALTRNGK